MSIIKPLYHLSEICSLKEIEEIVICPGSRSAALTLAFTRNPDIETSVLADERSAAFVALGKSLATKKTVGLVCTSGSAALNFAPAIAEAFFQEIPLLVLTADRPPEWIHQYDGQTIFQSEIYGKHVKKSYQLPADYSHPDAIWSLERIINEAIDLSQSHPKGPVHINVPIREPFYPAENEQFEFKGISRVINSLEIEKTIKNEDWQLLLEIWENAESKIIAVGQNFENLNIVLKDPMGALVLGDIISNLNIENEIKMHDIFLAKSENLEAPELLITVGKSFISKSLKQYLRKNKPRYHWHIQQHQDVIDPFQSITHKIQMNENSFFKTLFETLDLRAFKNGDYDETSEFETQWNNANEDAKKYLGKYLNKETFGELSTTSKVLEKIPNQSIIHLGNSMPVRYSNLVFGLDKQKYTVFCNRGTSGIDGILSTAVGHATKTEKIVTCLIGDMSYFYDINALWRSQIPNNLRIVLINNAGGNIFRIIDGPSKQPELDEYFVTSQQKNSRLTCKESGIIYLPVENNQDLNNALSSFFDPSETAKLIEVFTNGEADAQIFKEFKAAF